MKKIFVLYCTLHIFSFLFAQLSNTNNCAQFTSSGIKRYIAGEYIKAIANFEAAKLCLSTIENSDIDEWIYKSTTCLDYTALANAELENENYLKALDKYNFVILLNPNDEHCKKNSEYCLQKLIPIDNMVYIESDTFLMGSNEGEINEAPEHEVFLKGYYIDKFEVTNLEYSIFLNIKKISVDSVSYWINIDDEHCKLISIEGWYIPVKGYENFPVVEVSWYGANAYAEWLGKRLPTEAEWENAAKGGKYSANNLYSGCSIADSIAIYRNNSNFEICTVGSKKPNELGIFDMSGNAWEWCLDWYMPNFYYISPKDNPVVINDTDFKVLKGGGCASFETNLRPQYRNYFYPEETQKSFGFRCVREE